MKSISVYFFGLILITGHVFAQNIQSSELVSKCKRKETKDCGIPPYASSQVDKRFGRAPLVVEFDASESFDEDGQIVSYKWDLGDGETKTGEVVEHTFTSNGEFEVQLTVTDNDQKISQRSITIKIDEGAPIARLSWEQTKLTMQEDAAQVVATLNLEGLQAPTLDFDLELELILHGSIDSGRFSTPFLQVTIPAGETSIDIPLNLVDDDEVNGPQMLALIIDRASLNAGVEVQSPKVVEVTIEDSDFEYRKECSGMAGDFHTNPDGGVGGFVADTAFVDDDNIFIDSGAQICGNSNISGAPIDDETPLRIQDNVIVWDSFVHGETQLSGNAFVQDSELNDVVADGDATIVNSIMLDSEVLDSAQVFNVFEPQFGTGAVNMLVEGSAVLSTGFTEGSLISVNSCHLQGEARVYNTQLLAEDLDKENCQVRENALLLGRKRFGGSQFGNSIASGDIKMIGNFGSIVSTVVSPNAPLNQITGQALLYSSPDLGLGEVGLTSGVRVDGNAEVRNSFLGEGVWAGGDVFISVSSFCQGETLLSGEFTGVFDCPLDPPQALVWR